MKKMFIITGGLLVLLTFFLLSFMPPQPIMWGHTGSPGEGNCTDCHGSFLLNAGAGSVQISSIPAMMNNNYVPGQTYVINVTVTRNGDSLFAFDFEAVDSFGNDAGILTVTDSIHTVSKIYSVNSRKNMFFNYFGTNPDSFTFQFDWTAPMAGQVGFYANGFVSNSNGMVTGDYVYSDSIIGLTPSLQAGLVDYVSNEDLEVFPNPVKSCFYIRSKHFNVPHICLIGSEGERLDLEGESSVLEHSKCWKYVLPENIKTGNYYVKTNIGTRRVLIIN